MSRYFKGSTYQKRGAFWLPALEYVVAEDPILPWYRPAAQPRSRPGRAGNLATRETTKDNKNLNINSTLAGNLARRETTKDNKNLNINSTLAGNLATRETT